MLSGGVSGDVALWEMDDVLFQDAAEVGSDVLCGVVCGDTGRDGGRGLEGEE